MSNEPLTALECSVLDRLADTLIPPARDAICASQAGVSGSLLVQAETYAPDLPGRLRTVISEATGIEPVAALTALKLRDSAAYDAFCETIAAIYFLSPQVRATIGFAGREPKPARVEVSDLEDLLMPVLEAGFAPRAV